MDYAKVYGQMHEQWPKLFAGNSIKNHVEAIAELVKECRPTRLLDYGSGKGYQYLARRAHEAWGGLLPYCYDVGVRQLSEKPEGLFDGVISTDVLEHIDEPDVDGILDDIFSSVLVRPECDLGKSFVFLAIACRPSKKLLPDGRDAHLTVRPPEWWAGKLTKFERPGLIIRAVYDTGNV
ncbi:hypothetical protein MesoLjLc_50720 [Mesorhizobium sp. L-8-10]|uniref:class I SAM-dependent methyltransferase n=1 Tax=Mesorhizobium sp. L-8-10 TaxID=2744523 RepID=UPI001927F01C|nr:hypothetical protein [Mesorhizobium sp. L-8-10]BCH33142.1 hypothetical protein MesoLjLc_50720 [Mesorhizobium sp. L-8-10]